MIMSWIRHAYVCRMRLAEGEEPQLVRWFFCDPGARVFPWPHRFTSLRTWYPDRGNPPNEQRTNDGLGEQWPLVDYRWDRGVNHHGLAGTHFCGPAEAFLRGGLPSDPALLLDADGVPVCCRRADQPCGGQEEGGCDG